MTDRLVSVPGRGVADGQVAGAALRVSWVDAGEVPPTEAEWSDEPPSLRSRVRTIASSAGRRPGVFFSGLILFVILLWAAIPSLFTSQSATIGNVAIRLQGPSLAHWFGTDEIGRDVYTRVVYGARLSLLAGLLAVGLGLVIGSALGLVAGFLGGSTDLVIMRVVDVLLAVPSLLLALMLVAALGSGPTNVAIAVGVGGVATTSRVMRSEVLRVRTSPYVEAAHAAGARWFTVLRRHVLPNSAGPVLALAVLDFGYAIMAISSLSYLGFGVRPPTPEWGSMVADGQNYLSSAWWIAIFPGIAVALTVLCAAHLGRALERETTGER